MLLMLRERFDNDPILAGMSTRTLAEDPDLDLDAGAGGPELVCYSRHAANLSARKPPFSDQQLSENDRVGMVDREASNGGSPGRRVTHKNRSVPLEMLVPRVATRVKELGRHRGRRIDACKIRALMGVSSEQLRHRLSSVVAPPCC